MFKTWWLWWLPRTLLGLGEPVSVDLVTGVAGAAQGVSQGCFTFCSRCTSLLSKKEKHFCIFQDVISVELPSAPPSPGEFWGARSHLKQRPAGAAVRVGDGEDLLPPFWRSPPGGSAPAALSSLILHPSSLGLSSGFLAQSRCLSLTHSFAYLVSS